MLARLQDVLTDESAEEEFCQVIRLDSGFISRRVIRLKQITCLWYKFGHYN